MPRILFLTAPHDDYLADGLLHGLRTLLGTEVVDYPKAEHMYEGFSASAGEHVHGLGFTLHGLLPEIELNRHRVPDRAVDGEFDLVVFADIWHSFGRFVELAPRISKVPMAVLDGADRVEPYPYSGFWWRKRAWWFLPRAHTRATYFKREISPWTGWFRSYLTLPPPLAAMLPSIRHMREIAFSIPAEKVLDAPPAGKSRLFASHIVDAEVAERVGGSTAYAFSDEASYYRDLQSASYGITMKRAGWDCMRHYEIAANGCVPCFRDLERKPRRCAPHGLNDENSVSYSSYEDLMRQLDAIDPGRYARLQAGALRWARENTTESRARYFLEACGMPIPAGEAAPPPPASLLRR